jgi:hypothetical protein
MRAGELGAHASPAEMVDRRADQRSASAP